MLRIALIALAVYVEAGRAGAVGNSAIAPLLRYQGNWQVTRSDSTKPERVVNECAAVGGYFACQQTVNGGPGSLLIIVPTNETGKYHTQVIEPSGRATGLNDLSIDGDRWSFVSRWNQGSTTIYYRTLNTFTGKNHIHFEQDESPDGKTWTTKSSGEEVRAAGH